MNSNIYLTSGPLKFLRHQNNKVQKYEVKDKNLILCFIQVSHRRIDENKFKQTTNSWNCCWRNNSYTP